MEYRLQKILARSGIASRRKAEDLIIQGKVSVNGVVVKDLGRCYDPEAHEITVNGRRVQPSEDKVYFLLNKPKGYVTTLHDPQKRPIVTSLLPEVSQRIFPVGRLDLDTEGALLMTNDGDLAHRILHPRNEVKKTYIAEVKGSPQAGVISRLEKGIMLEGKKTWPAKITVLSQKKQVTKLQITIHEGRKRQIRKMFATVGFPVLQLKRIAYGNLHLGNLKSGKYRRLNEKDIKQIFSQKKSLYNR